MLGDTGKKIRAGISFKANTRGLTEAIHALNKLQKEFRTTTGTAITFNEANDAASRSLGRLSASNLAAMGTLNSLQAQMAANSAASRTYKTNMEALGDEMRAIDAIDLTIGDLSDQGDTGQVAIDSLRSELQTGIENMDEGEMSMKIPQQHSRTIKGMEGPSGLSQQNNIVDFLTDPQADSLDITSPISDQVDRFQNAEESINAIKSHDDSGIFEDTIQALEEVPTLSEVMRKRLEGDMSDDIPIQDLPLGLTQLDSDDGDEMFAESPFSQDFISTFSEDSDGTDRSISEILTMPDKDMAEMLNTSDADFTDAFDGEDGLKNFRQEILDVFTTHQNEHFGSNTTIRQMLQQSNTPTTAGNKPTDLPDAFQQHDITGIEQIMASTDEELKEVMKTAGVPGSASNFRAKMMTPAEGPPLTIAPGEITDEFGDIPDREDSAFGRRLTSPLADSDAAQEQSLLSSLKTANTKAHGQRGKDQRPLNSLKNVLDDFYLKDGRGIKRALKNMPQGKRTRLTGGSKQILSEIPESEVEDVVQTLVRGSLDPSDGAFNQSTIDEMSRQSGMQGALQHAMPMVPETDGQGQTKLDSFTKANPSEYLDEDFFNQFHKLADLMDESEQIQNAVMRSSSIDGALKRLHNTDPGRALQLEQWADNNKEQFQGIFDNLDIQKMLDDGRAESMADVRNKIMDRFNRGESSPIGGGSGGGNINHNQGEMLNRLLQGVGKKSEVGLTQESAQLGLMQEMVDADNDTSRYRDAQDLLRRTMMPADLESSVSVGNDILSTDEFTTGHIAEDVQNELGDMLVTDNDGQNIGDYIGQELRNNDYSLFELLSDDSDSRGASDVVSNAFSTSGLEHDDPNEVARTVQALERTLPDTFEKVANDSAIGLQNTRRQTGTDINELLPGAGITGFQSGSGDENVSETYDRFNSEFSQYNKSLKKTFDDFNAEQASHWLSQSVSKNNIPGMKKGMNRRRGALSGVMRGGTILSERIGIDNPRHIRQVNDAVQNAQHIFDESIPFLNARSFHLGSFTIEMENALKMLFKVTAMIGPFIALIGAAAVAVGTLTAALASMVAVGAISFLEEMEETMAGVANKGDAAKELLKTIKNMALEAVAPLRNVNIGGEGPGGMELFVSTIRGLLVLLNRFSNIMATVLESPAMLEVLDALHNFAFIDDGDEELAEDLRDAFENMLPFIMKVVSAIVGGIIPAMLFFADITDGLGENLVDMLGNLTNALALVIAYGVGFMTVLFTAISMVTWAIGKLVDVVDILLGALSYLPLVDLSANSVAFALGSVSAALVVVIKALTTLLPILGGLASMFSYLASTTTAATIANTRYATSLYSIASAAYAAKFALMKLVSVVGMIVLGISLIVDGIAALLGFETLVWDIDSAGQAVAYTLAGIASILTGIYLSLKTIGGALGMNITLTKVWATSAWATAGAFAAIKFKLLAIVKVALVILGIIKLPVIVIGSIVAGLALIVRYLYKAESPLLTFNYWSEKVLETWEKITDAIDTAASYIPSVDGGATNEDTRFHSDDGSVGTTNSDTRFHSDDGSLGVTDGSSAAMFDIDITNNGVKDDDLTRKIQRDIERWWKDKMSDYTP